MVVATTSREDAARAALAVSRTGLPSATTRVVVVDVLPRLPNGKPDYAAVLAACDLDATPTPATGPGVVATYEAVLGKPVTPEDSFVSAGGDSLSYVELSIRLEELLGELPTGWHLRPVRDLDTTGRHRRRVHRVEMTVALRAVAIVLVVGSHAGAWHVIGGAHLLLGIAGCNFARFQRTAQGAWRSARRVAAPAIGWLAFVAAASDQFSWPHALLANTSSARPTPDGRTGSWKH